MCIRDRHTDYNFEGQKLSAYTIDNSRIALALMPYENSVSTRLVVIGEDGQETLSADLPYQASSISLYGNTAVALVDSQIYFYTVSTGVAQGQVAAGSDAKAIALMDEQTAYVLGVSEIRKVSAP